MAKTYHATQHWNYWLNQHDGHFLIEREHRWLKKLLPEYYGKHCLLIGVPHQANLLKSCVTSNNIVLSTLFSRHLSEKMIESNFHELPVASGSVDLVLLPHTLECTENPHKLLAESCRIVKPEGHIIILGFNPLSLWGLRKYFNKSTDMPWSLNYHPPGKIKKWLGLADFELVKHETFMFAPHRVYQHLSFLDWLGKKFFKPFGSVYVLIAKAKVIPLTPIKLRWEQRLSSLGATLPGPTMRDF